MKVTEALSTLLISSPDEVGLIHRITGVLRDLSLNIINNSEHVDADTSWFFMRTQFTGEVYAKELVDTLSATLPKPADIRIAGHRPKDVVILAGKEPHCVGDLLLRHSNGELNVNIQAVISNHPTLEKLVSRFGIRFHCVPVESEDRTLHESNLLNLIETLRPNYLVLAKYMRILTPSFARAFPNRILNIHHSFLPAFAGANPYKQAYVRGVKVIGATAHFVNEQLDDGPIIAQSVLPVTHSHTIKSMTQDGREIEKVVLAKAFRLLLEDRIFVHGNRTIIFE